MEQKPIVIVTDSSLTVPFLRRSTDVRQWDQPGPMPHDKLVDAVADADALFCRVRDHVDKEVLDAAPNLRVIGTMSVGYEHIDMDECNKRGIPVGRTEDPEPVAELAVALALAVGRRLVEATKAAERGESAAWSPYFMCGKALTGSTVGIYGLGRIGRSIAKKVEAFGAHIIYNDIYCKLQCRHYEPVFFDEMLRRSDFIILSAPVDFSNVGIFNSNAFKDMKKDAVLINVARGTLVNTADLYEALSEGKIGGAGLDVTDPEPLPASHPLFALTNCVILPHIGSATFATRKHMASVTERNIYNALCGKEMIHRIS